MTGFRVTKYAPAFRSPDGAYCRSEWTSATDVGRNFDGTTLACADYLNVEADYVEAVHRFMAALRITTLRVVDLEVNDNSDVLPTALVAETKLWTSTVSEGEVVSAVRLDQVIRLALREAIWCRLEGVSGFYVHFGYDYYMYVGAESSELAPPLLPRGIYAEPFESPYRKESSGTTSPMELE
ncbi:MAG: hypothetical protein QM784_38965 [Polyangiaceae bacterium]